MEAVEIVEIGPREGLQYYHRYIDFPKKISLIESIFDAGFKKSEITSLVYPKVIPQMQDAIDLLSNIKRGTGICQVLVPNELGCRNAVAYNADEVVVWIFLTDEMNYLTQRRSRSETLKEISTITEIAKENEIKVSAYIGGAFGYPGMDYNLCKQVKGLASKLIQLGCYQVCLNDEFCTANPRLVRNYITTYMNEIESDRLSVHFHDNRGLGLANIFTAYETGIRTFRCSLGGSGVHAELEYETKTGEPAYRQYPSVPTEDVVCMFEEMGIDTGIDFEKLVICGRNMEELVKTKLHSRIISNRFDDATLTWIRRFASELFPVDRTEKAVKQIRRRNDK